MTLKEGVKLYVVTLSSSITCIFHLYVLTTFITLILVSWPSLLIEMFNDWSVSPPKEGDSLN